MIHNTCLVKHDPPNSYGDCVRACVSSILETPCEAVPHFYDDGNGELAFDRMRVWLAGYGRIPAYYPLPGEMSLDEVLREASMYKTEFMLFCSNAGGDHCVIGADGKIAHDPAWYRTAITGPHSSGVWIVILLARA